MHPVLLAAIIWLSAIVLICFLNYKFHHRTEKINTIEDDPNFWDNSRMYDDLFLNQN